jgi:hypothetical protein
MCGFPIVISERDVSRHNHLKNICVRFEVFTAVTVEYAVFWDIKTQFLQHRKHVTSPLQSATN